MPWCDECDRYLTPSSLEGDGSCPACGLAVAEAEDAPSAPWHFKLLVAMAVVYLGWRLVQLVAAIA